MATPLACRVSAVAALVVLSPLALGATLPAAPTIVAGPGAWLTQYATPAMVTTASAGLSLRNEDIMKHDVVSEEFGPDGQPWCLDAPPGRCPLFHSPLIALGVTAAVQGIEATPPGTHAFYCTLHTAMRGTLVVAPEAT